MSGNSQILRHSTQGSSGPGDQEIEEEAAAPWSFPFSEDHLPSKDGVWEIAPVNHAKDKESHPICTGCHKPIHDAKVCEALHRPWHAQCLRCICCSQQLRHKCFITPTGQLICERDFNRLSHVTCAGCEAILPRNIEVHRVHGNVYHRYCFTCIKCKKQLVAGDKLYLRFDNRLECKKCFDNQFS